MDADLSLADRLRALARLQPRGDAAQRAVMAMTSRRREPGTVSTASQRAGLQASLPPTAPPPAARTTLPRDTAAPATPAPAPAPDRPMADAAPSSGTTATRLPIEPWPVPAATLRAPAGPPLPPAEPLPSMPVIARRRARAVLAPLAQAPVAGTAIDVDALVQAVGRRQPVEHLPRLMAWSTQRGAQLLVDVGAGLQPLADDVHQVIDELQRVVGRHRLQLMEFAGTPLRGCGAGARSNWRAWRPPAVGTPVIVVSDLSVIRRDFDPDWVRPDAWVDFARAARDAGCPAVVLTPFPPHRVASALRSCLTLLPWAEWLDAGRVRRVLRDARQRPGRVG